MSRLLEYLPWYERNSEVFKEICKAEEIEFDKLDLELKDLEKQFIVDTATWGLAIYEKELGLAVRPSKSLDERRAIIKAKWRGIGKVDAEMIKAIVKAFTNSDVEVTFNGRINIIFSNEKVIRLNISDMFNAINEVKPAHLDYNFTSEHHTTLELKTDYKKYDIIYPICGTYLCGTYPNIAVEGIQSGTNLNLETQSINAVHHYPLTGVAITKE